MAQNAFSKSITLGMLFKVDVANLNAGWTEETVTPLKKIEAADNARYPYVSGQALRRYLRDTLSDNVERGEDGKPLHAFSPEEPGPDPKSPILTAGRPDLYIDDDLFGFMRATKGRTRRRESPLRVSAAFGLFPYLGDRDLGTHSALRVTHDPEKGGAIFETEVTNNVFRTTWLLELDRVGVWHGYENNASQDLSAIERLDDRERRNRVRALLHALKYLRGGARQARLLVELVPQMVVYARMTKKVAMFLNALQVRPADGKYDLVTDPLEDVLRDYAPDIETLVVGLRDGFVTLGRDMLLQQVRTALAERAEAIRPQVLSVGQAVEAMEIDVNQARF